MKGAASEIGARALQATAFKMEMAAHDDDIARVEAQMPLLKMEFERLQPELAKGGWTSQEV
jgi:HPt (histidine-containing phosphotransfer) domain-containing protein